VPPVSVILPVSTDASGLPVAAACILDQSLTNLELIIILNGSDAATQAAATKIAQADGRVRTLQLADRGLTAALNHAIEHASHEFIARMDSDDRCPPHRLAVQVEAMTADPGLSAVGSAWRMETTEGVCRAIMRPPTSALAAWWGLLAANPFAHGSMLMRRSHVLAQGGYDAEFPRAQDYDLWLRLAARSGGVKAVPEVLYTHIVKPAIGFSSSALQAACAARALTRAWSRLQSGLGEGSTVEGAVAAALGHGRSAADISALIAQVESETPSATGQCARAWLLSLLDPKNTVPANLPATTLEVRLQELRDNGIERAWIWGAGAHTERLMPLLEPSGIAMLGMIDDALAGGTFHGRAIQSPTVMQRGDHAIVSSDAHEDAIWRASAQHRARGVLVHRLYWRSD